MKKITILGSTGSIGTQTLEVIAANPDRFCVTALTCGRNTALLAKQIAVFRPRLAVTERREDALALAAQFPQVTFLHGREGLIEAATADCDMVVNALMGMRGLEPTYHAILAGRDIALANKETLVAGGRLVMETVSEKGVRLLPVDSEHSAIFQCLEGNRHRPVKKILLTASGGPFRGFSREELEHVTPAQALKHPNWSMGAKITIDSATMRSSRRNGCSMCLPRGFRSWCIRRAFCTRRWSLRTILLSVRWACRICGFRSVWPWVIRSVLRIRTHR